MEPTTFLNLPTEILEKILEYNKLPLPTLFELALSCMRLHDICLPLHLKRSGIPNPEELCKIIVPAKMQEHDGLAALRLARWVTKTKRLECHFQAWQGALSTMVLQLSQVEAFVNKLTIVEEVILEFDPHDTPYTTYADLYDKDIVAWSDGMGKLLNTIVERGCRTLEINGLTQLHDVYTCIRMVPSDSLQPVPFGTETPHNSKATGKAARVSDGAHIDVLSGRTWRYKRNRRILYPGSSSEDSLLTHLSPLARATSKLTSLAIGSKSLLYPPLLQWTCSILACSPIDTLILRNTAVLQSNVSPVTTLLPMACPNSLRRLTLLSLGAISLGNLTAMVCTFPQLEHLSIEGIDTSLCNYSQLEPAMQLPKHLTDIRVQLDWILPAYSFDAKSFPALKTLTLICIEEGTINRSPPHLVLWSLGANVPASLNIEIVAGSNIAWWMDSERYVISDKRPGALGGYRYVTGIVMTLKFDILLKPLQSDIPKTRETVEKWFSHFPALKRVGIDAKVRNPHTQVPAIEWFCQHAMPQVLRKLEILEVNGRVVDINRILKDAESGSVRPPWS